MLMFSDVCLSDFALTDLFFMVIYLFIVSIVCFCWVYCWLIVIYLTNWKSWGVILAGYTQLLLLPLLGAHFCFLGQWEGPQQHNSFVCSLDYYYYFFFINWFIFCSTQTYTVLLWPWQSPSVGFKDYLSWCEPLIQIYCKLISSLYHHITTHVCKHNFCLTCSHTLLLFSAWLSCLSEWSMFGLTLQLSDVVTLSLCMYQSCPAGGRKSPLLLHLLKLKCFVFTLNI